MYNLAAGIALPPVAGYFFVKYGRQMAAHTTKFLETNGPTFYQGVVFATDKMGRAALQAKVAIAQGLSLAQGELVKGVSWLSRQGASQSSVICEKALRLGRNFTSLETLTPAQGAVLSLGITLAAPFISLALSESKQLRVRPYTKIVISHLAAGSFFYGALKVAGQINGVPSHLSLGGAATLTITVMAIKIISSLTLA